MTEIEKDFIENYNDCLQPISKEILKSAKEKIKNDEFFQLLVSLDTPDFKLHKDYIKICDNPNWKDASGDVISKKDRDECKEFHINILERYTNYLKILIRTDGFETSNY
ncbi:hypothetical protein JE952_002401 [Flavobacterium psychrophilum]|nr:hypothetical protein [Flavobacterium psychrophilum]